MQKQKLKCSEFNNQFQLQQSSEPLSPTFLTTGTHMLKSYISMLKIIALVPL